MSKHAAAPSIMASPDNLLKEDNEGHSCWIQAFVGFKRYTFAWMKSLTIISFYIQTLILGPGTDYAN
ncbi:hypothetical protein GTU79_00185 [Sodalis ligni]|uniref:hypothetical protein n=1 Tax=Sodalis ligni TaxID=2697027 RepID=UPI001BDE5F74|nr:hypothetical protein [Sodalis ligni]QWA11308.1 hypothetical protein GTU79_00185 [Sodalis ligni]